MPFVEFCARSEKLTAFDVPNGTLVSVFLARSAKLKPPPLPKTDFCSTEFGASLTGVDVELGGCVLAGDSLPVTGVRVVDDGNLNENVLGVSFGLLSPLPFVLPPNIFVDGVLVIVVAPNAAEPPNNGDDSTGFSDESEMIIIQTKFIYLQTNFMLKSK